MAHVFLRPAAAAVTLALAATLTSVGAVAAPAGAAGPAAYSSERGVTAEPVARKRLSKAAKKARKQRKRLQTVVAPTPAPAPVPSTPAEAAVAFARAQLGDPYGWGGSGPDLWDCSGLTMRAWEAAGVLLPRTTVEQYRATTAVTAAELLPGDLVFWASNPARPRTIHHVAIYLGGDRILHAPNPDRPVEEQALLYNGTPAFFTRPAPVAG